MQRRTPTTATIQHIRAGMKATGATEERIAEAADIALTDLNSRLNGEHEFTVAELVMAGGFLRLPLTTLFAEAA